MKIDIITLFPDMFVGPFSESIIARAIKEKHLSINYHQLRDYSIDKHHNVDDVPYGGGGGMLMTCQPIFDCIETIKKTNQGPVIFLTPKGDTFSQEKAEELCKIDEMIILCGRYEGVDQRIIDKLVDMQISIGEYVLTGGELAAMILVDSITRLIDGVITDNSSQFDSYSKEFDRKREYPNYTRPQEFKNMKVPDVLVNGNHKEIEKWRKENLK